MNVTDQLIIPDSEFSWKFVRASGPGGQNVNKVASKAVLFWDLAHSPSIPESIKIRLALQQKRYFTNEGQIFISSQKYRDQDKNRGDCLEKLKAIIVQALHVPKTRKATRPTRGSQRARLAAKKHRSSLKGQRRVTGED